MDKNAEVGQELKYETSDARFKPILYFIAALLALVVVSFGLMLWMFDAMEERAAAVDRPPSPLADPNWLPPEPRLQSDPRLEFEAYRLEAEKTLHSYEWIDKEAGVVRIPIQRAMELLAERGIGATEPTADSRQPAN